MSQSCTWMHCLTCVSASVYQCCERSRGVINDGGWLKLGTHMPYMLGNIVQVLFGPSPECVIPGRTLFGGEGEEEEVILTEPPPE